MSAAEGASEASSPEQANERTDKRVAHYFCLYSWLLSTIVHPKKGSTYDNCQDNDEDGEVVKNVNIHTRQRLLHKGVNDDDDN